MSCVRSRLIASLALVVVLALAAGCSSEASVAVAPPVSPKPTVAAEATAPIPTPTPTPVPEPGTVRFAVVGEVVTDPLKASPVRPTDVAVIDALYDGLTVLTETGWEPALADSFTLAGDGVTWTAELGDATFSDGSPINAPAVVATFDRLRGSPRFDSRP